MSRNNKRRRKNRILYYALALIAILFTTAFVSLFMQNGTTDTLFASGKNFGSKAKKVEETKPVDTGFYKITPGSYDSEDTAVIEAIYPESAQFDLMNISSGRTYTLSYDGTTMFLDKYGTSMSANQLEAGQIVDVRFLKEFKFASRVALSSGTFTYDNVSKYSFNRQNQSATVGNENYSLSDSAIFLSDGKQISQENIVSGDILTIRGIGYNIYSVVVERGHGYLRIDDPGTLSGGWIEVGQAVIQKIDGDLLLNVPEGGYEVRITAKGVDVIKPVTIVRNIETKLDVSDVVPEEAQTGKIVFAITPSVATTYVDGKEIDTTKPVSLEYGIHQLIVKAQGYDSVTRYIRVAQELATISVDLDRATEPSISENSQVVSQNDFNSVSPNSISSNSASADGYKIYVDSPANTEIYLDGAYKGIIPCNFAKVTGSHTFTLSKSGYKTKSYTVDIDGMDRDVSIAFSELEKDGSVSGNSISKNSITDNEIITENDVKDEKEKLADPIVEPKNDNNMPKDEKDLPLDEEEEPAVEHAGNVINSIVKWVSRRF